MESWEEFFKALTYKPGFTFDYERRIDFNEHVLHMTMRVVDSRNPQAVTPRHIFEEQARRLSLIPITKSVRLPRWYDIEHAKDFMRYAIIDMEHHEFDEWYRVDGVLVDDPHK